MHLILKFSLKPAGDRVEGKYLAVPKLPNDNLMTKCTEIAWSKCQPPRVR